MLDIDAFFTHLEQRISTLEAEGKAALEQGKQDVANLKTAAVAEAKDILAKAEQLLGRL
jgi:hypothetical protein